MDRVLFISSKPSFSWRGPCIRAGHDLLALAQLGYAVDFLTVPIGATPSIPGVRTIRAPNLLRARNLPEGASLRKVVFDGLLLIMGLSLALRERYTVVHGLDDAGILAWIIGRFGRASVVFEKHADAVRSRRSAWHRLLGRVYGRAERFVLRRADIVIGAGPEILPAMQALGNGHRAFRIPDIPSALDEPPAQHVAECRSRLTRNLDDILVTYVGSFASFQGLDLLFGAMPLVCASDERVHFVIVGGTAGEIARQRHEGARRKLAQSVTFLGRVGPGELAAVLAASDILVAPRLSGVHAPMKVLDYLQSGTAIVAADSAANRDILTSEVAVLTAPYAENFATGILGLCRNPARRHELGRRGKERIARFHRFDQFKENLRIVYAYVTVTRHPPAEA
jgi:glycosyltransferase involved in cell wall biosynthesis